MLYSSTCEYAIRALTHLATRDPGELTLLVDIAEAEALPRAFLGKILQGLGRAGLVRSARGPAGGFGLARPASEISLLDIKDLVDGKGDLERCAVGLDLCSDDEPCPLHEAFKPLRSAIADYLRDTTLDDLARATREKRAALVGSVESE